VTPGEIRGKALIERWGLLLCGYFADIFGYLRIPRYLYGMNKALPYIGWGIALLLCAYLVWPDPQPPSYKPDPLRAENDSLMRVIDVRDQRVQRLTEYMEELRGYADSLESHRPTPQTTYNDARKITRRWPIDTMLRFMGRLPDDPIAD